MKKTQAEETIEYVRKEMEEGLTRVPAHMHDGIRRYVMTGGHVGDFLTALFEHNFMEIVLRADDKNFACLREYARFLHNDVPGGCKGSREKVASWRKRGGFIGIMEAENLEAPTRDLKGEPVHP